MKQLFLLFAIAFSFFASSAQKRDSLVYDTNSKVESRTSKTIYKYLNDETFQYEHEVVKAPTSLLERIFSRIGDLIRFIDRGGKPVSYTFYAIFFIILLIAIIKLVGMKYQRLFIKSAKIKGDGVDLYDESLKDIDINKLISESIEKERFRTAVRYMYIKFLRLLTDNELIEWKKNKTNREYKKELRKTKYSKSFQHLTIIYDYVWYGEFIINEEQFYKFRNDFDKVYKDF